MQIFGEAVGKRAQECGFGALRDLNAWVAVATDWESPFEWRRKRVPECG